MQAPIGDSETTSVHQAALAGCRLDGRAFDECPPVEVRTAVVLQAAGSAHVRLGDAEVLVGVKVPPCYACLSALLHS